MPECAGMACGLLCQWGMLVWGASLQGVLAVLGLVLGWHWHTAILRAVAAHLCPGVGSRRGVEQVQMPVCLTWRRWDHNLCCAGSSHPPQSNPSFLPSITLMLAQHPMCGQCVAIALLVAHRHCYAGGNTLVVGVLVFTPVAAALVTKAGPLDDVVGQLVNSREAKCKMRVRSGQEC